MIKELYTVKSFFVLGDSLKSCFGCDYCRADDDLVYSYHKVPGEINPLFKTLPVAVNLFYGDPVLQWDNTLSLLKELERNGHTGIVVLITKGKLPEIPKFNLNLHVGITIGPDEISKKSLEYNLEKSSNSWYSFNIEYRPICNGINDSSDFIEYVISLASKYNTKIAYSGLQLPPKPLNDKYIPYDNRKFSSQKYISEEVDNRIKDIAKKFNVLVFKKTSCLLSYVHGLDHDYNAHYLKPVGVGCNDCINFKKCNKIIPSVNKNLPFDYELIERENYTCSFVRNGLCKTPNKECLSMKGTFIRPLGINEITRGDARVIKWLTGMMVDGVDSLIETPFLSDFWKI